MQTSLLETITAAPGRIDRAAGVLRGVKILGRASRNGREYSDKAVREAAAFYEGSQVCQDHPDRGRREEVRGLGEWVGVLRNVRIKPDGVYGDLHLRKASPFFEAIMEAAEKFPNSLGLSHNASGDVVTKGGKTVVESVERVVSVDLVTRPATTSGLFESVQPRRPRLIEMAGVNPSPMMATEMSECVRQRVPRLIELARYRR